MLRRTPALLALLAALLLPGAATAQLCDGRMPPIGGDGRALGHLPYGDAPEGELVDAPAGFGLGRGCRLRADVIADLGRLIAAAAGAGFPGALRGLSCHRSIARQTEVFCRERPDGPAADRAISVAPPGHSEHATGYALDFAIRPRGDCPDAEACMASTPAFRWLAANGPRYGFEMSFPAGNRQRVKWEPWHWRWVGVSAEAPAAARARMLFARARRDFPAEPAVPSLRALTYAAPAPYVALPQPAPAPDRRRKRRRR